MVRPAGTPTAAQKRRLATAARRRDTANTEFHQALRNVHEEGVSIRQLAELLGRSTNTIQRWLKESP